MKFSITNNIRQLITLNSALLILITSCSIQKQIEKSAKADVLAAPSLQAAHVGISVYEPATGKYWYNYQGDKYFVPASNTKIPTCYAAMKYLGDSLVAANILETDTAIVVAPGGDPTLLHPEFKFQPLITWLQREKRKIYINANYWKDAPLGAGWSWNDYNESYMAERNPMPVYGNVITWIQEINDSTKPATIYSIPEIDWEVNFSDANESRNFSVRRALGTNSYTLTTGKEKKREQSVPFQTNRVEAAIELLRDTTGKEIRYIELNQIWRFGQGMKNDVVPVYSQRTDSMLKPMMHRSDNFFAEQSLQMVSLSKLGIMNDSEIIDTLLKTDFRDLPQKPRWVDGSGLSRYNLFTPQDFVAILHKMQQEFPMPRIKEIFPTGGEGTISSYYKTESGFIYGKTGTLSGVVAFSGFLYTKKGKLLIFSTLVNNHQASATDVRRAVEKFLVGIRNKY